MEASKSRLQRYVTLRNCQTIISRRRTRYDILMAERNESFMQKLKQIRRIAAIF